MRSYVIVAGALFSVVAAVAQVPGPNVVPNEAINGAVWRALALPVIPPVTGSKTVFRAPLVNGPQTVLMAPEICAVPLVETRGTPTNDRIAGRVPDPRIDPKMAVAPRIPACPSIPAASRRP